MAADLAGPRFPRLEKSPVKRSLFCARLRSLIAAITQAPQCSEAPCHIHAEFRCYVHKPYSASMLRAASTLFFEAPCPFFAPLCAMVLLEQLRFCVRRRVCTLLSIGPAFPKGLSCGLARLREGLPVSVNHIKGATPSAANRLAFFARLACAERAARRAGASGWSGQSGATRAPGARKGTRSTQENPASKKPNRNQRGLS